MNRTVVQRHVRDVEVNHDNVTPSTYFSMDHSVSSFFCNMQTFAQLSVIPHLQRHLARAKQLATTYPLFVLALVICYLIVMLWFLLIVLSVGGVIDGRNSNESLWWVAVGSSLLLLVMAVLSIGMQIRQNQLERALRVNTPPSPPLATSPNV